MKQTCFGIVCFILLFVISGSCPASFVQDMNKFGDMDNSGMVWMESLGQISKVYFWDHKSTKQIACQSSPSSYSPNVPVMDSGDAAWRAASGDGRSIFYWDGNTVTELAHVANATGYSLTNPCIDNGTVSWAQIDNDSKTVFYWDGNTVAQVADQAIPDWYTLSAPSVSNGQIAWLGGDGEIYFWDGNTVDQVTDYGDPASYSPTAPILDNNNVFWSQIKYSKYFDDEYKVWKWDGATIINIAAQSGTFSYSPDTLSVSNSQAAWQGPDGQIYFWDGASTIPVTNYSDPGAYSSTVPVLDNGAIAWKEIRSCQDNSYYDWWTWEWIEDITPGQETIYYWDGARTIQVCSQSVAQPYSPTLPALNNGNIGWKGPDGDMHYWNGKYVQNISDNDMYVTKVTTAAGSPGNYSPSTSKPQLSNGKIAWGDNLGKIYMWDGDTVSIAASICNPEGYSSNSFQMDNGNLAWKETLCEHWTCEEFIYFSDGATITMLEQISDPQNYSAITNPGLDGNTVAWGKASANEMEIYYWDGTTTSLVATSIGFSGYTPNAPSVDNGQIAWLDSDREIYFWNGASTIAITSGGKGVGYTVATAPVLDNGTIAWGGIDENGFTIYYWNGATTAEIATISESNAYSPDTVALSNGQIAWRGDYGDIYFWDGTSVENLTGCGNPGSYTIVSSWPVLENNAIAWSESYSGTSIRYWDGTSIIEVAKYSEPGMYSPTSPSLSNGALAWRGPDGSINYWDGKPANDKDSDGVPNQFDLHPDTPEGSAVYSDGGRADDLYDQIDKLAQGDMDLDGDVDEDDLAAYADLYGTPSLYTQDQLNATLEKFDVDRDGQIGLEEAIRALQIVVGFE